MSGTPALASPAPTRLMGVLRSWLRGRSSEIWPSPEVLARESGEPGALCRGSARVLVVDGFGATMAIRRFEADSSRPAVPVIAYSSMPLGDVTLAAHGLNGSLTKPCEDQELEDCLVRWCPRHCPAPAARGLAHASDRGYWQSAIRHHETRSPSLR